MSRSNNVEILENPAKWFASWKTIRESVTIDGEEIEKLKGGSLVYYDKEKKEKVVLKLPLRFALLDMELSSFKGFNESSKSSMWSNETKSSDQLVIIRSKEGKQLEFKKSEYKLVKEKVAALGCKFTQSVYGAIEVNGKWEIVNFQLSGSALSGSPEDFSKLTDEEKYEGFFNFTKMNKSKLYSHFLSFEGYKMKKKGQVKFTCPIYEVKEEIDQETSDKLNELDKQLTSYLNYYFDKPSVKEEVLKEEVVDDSLDY